LTVRMQRRGQLSLSGTSRGEEAVGLGAAAALQPGDWCFPSYRQMSSLLYWNVPVDRIMAALMGAPPEHIAENLPLAKQSTPPVQLAPYTVFLGASIPHAVGCALADKLEGRPIVTLAFVGEGATSEGDFYEGLNFAGVFEIPLVTIVQNNQWCISVPAHRQTAARTFADKAVAVGMKHSRVDGNDVFAVFAKTCEAVRGARRGEGPTLIEAVTYRIGDHNTADSAAVYRGEEEVSYWKTLDPLERFERYLRNAGLRSEQDIQNIATAIETELRQSIVRGRKVPPAAADLMFANHLIGDPGWSFRKQREELANELAGRNPFCERADEAAK
jgi:pyruvate dehydrogenase E1 component alpha subunit